MTKKNMTKISLGREKLEFSVFKRFYSAVTLAYTCTAFLRQFEFSNVFFGKVNIFPSSFDQKPFFDFTSHSLIFRLPVLGLKDIQYQPTLDWA